MKNTKTNIPKNQEKQKYVISADSNNSEDAVIFDGNPSYFQDSNIVWIRGDDVYI